MNNPVKTVCTSLPEDPSSFCQLSGFKAPKTSSPDEEEDVVSKTPKDMVKDVVESLKDMFSPECYNSVKEVTCLSSTPMCSDDEEKVLSLISKQYCEDKLTCAKSTSAGDLLATNFCSNLPDETTAEKYAKPAGLIEPNWSEPSKGHRSKKLFSGWFKPFFKRQRKNSKAMLTFNVQDIIKYKWEKNISGNKIV